ncbi:MAG: hypothetical protein ACOYM2_18885, partial [Rectinemataceae bacterium]
MATGKPGRASASSKHQAIIPATRTPFRKALEAKLSSMTVDQIRFLLGGLGQDSSLNLQKSEWIGWAADILDFADQAAFDKFFATRPNSGGISPRRRSGSITSTCLPLPGHSESRSS